MVYLRLSMRDCSEVLTNLRVMYVTSVGVWYHAMRRSKSYQESRCRRCSRELSFVGVAVTLIAVWLLCPMWWSTWSMSWQPWTSKLSFILNLDTNILYIYEIINQFILLLESSTTYLSGIWRDFNSLILFSFIFWIASFCPLKFSCNCWFSTPTIFLFCCLFSAF